MYRADLSGPAGVVKRNDFTSCEYVREVSALTATAIFPFKLCPAFCIKDTILDFFGSLSSSSLSSSCFRFLLKKFIFRCKKYAVSNYNIFSNSQFCPDSLALSGSGRFLEYEVKGLGLPRCKNL